MQTFETTDAKVARRCRYDQHRGQKTTVTVEVARHWAGSFRHGSLVQQPEALDRHGHRQTKHRCLNDAGTLYLVASHR
jgi:hypothetical protein